MRFEGRELKPFAEPVSAADLHEGSAYFAVTYVDDDMLIPTMETLVFIGKNLEIDDVAEAYFQEINSYRQGVRYGWDVKDGEASFYSGPENELHHIFDFDHALEELMKCSLRRSKS